MATIGDRVSRVSFKLGNRTDLLAPIGGVTGAASRIDLWLVDAYLSLGWGVDFAEMEQTTNFLTVNSSQTYPRPSDARAIKNITGYGSNGTVYTMNTVDIGYIRRYQSPQQGQQNATTTAPSTWAEFGNTLWFSPPPIGGINMVVDYWQVPQVDQTNQNTIESTQLLLPDDWLEILDYQATMRGHAELQEPDKTMALQQLLYGTVDPSTGKFSPGLIQQLMTRRQATTGFKDWGLQPQNMAMRSYISRS